MTATIQRTDPIHPISPRIDSFVSIIRMRDERGGGMSPTLPGQGFFFSYSFVFHLSLALTLRTNALMTKSLNDKKTTS